MTFTRPQVAIVAPEGVPLRFGAAAASERIVAFGLDVAIQATVLLLLGLPILFVFGPGGMMLLWFLLRHGYFVWFETRRNGATPGKKRFHLRVVRADGGPLTTGILVARNLSREVECFLPMVMLLAPEQWFDDHAGLVRAFAAVWLLLLLFFPLFNVQRLRLGDLLAGTRVVVSPPSELLRDLADGRAGSEPAKAARFVFQEAQLSIYGEHELHVLEDLLRKARAPGGAAALAAVTAKITVRIGWQGGEIPPAEQLLFLREFYAAQRRHLEHAMLLGRRRQRKKAAVRPAPPPR